MHDLRRHLAERRRGARQPFFSSISASWRPQSTERLTDRELLERFTRHWMANNFHKYAGPLPLPGYVSAIWFRR